MPVLTAPTIIGATTLTVDTLTDLPTEVQFQVLVGNELAIVVGPIPLTTTLEVSPALAVEHGTGERVELYTGQPLQAEVADGSITAAKLADGAVTSGKIEPEAVQTSHLGAGAVNAEKLEADLILSSNIRTAAVSNRVELTPSGLTVFDSANSQLLNVPTDDSPISITADVSASNLLVSGAAELQSADNTVSKGGALTLQAGVLAPTAKPTVSQGYATGMTPADPGVTGAYPGHGYYDPNGGTSGSTPCFVQAWTRNIGGNTWQTKVYEWTWSSGNLNRTTTLDDLVSDSDGVQASIVRIGSNWYVLRGIFHDHELMVTEYPRATGVMSDVAMVTSEFSDHDPLASPIGTDGTSLYVPGGAGTNALRVAVLNTSLTVLGTTELTEPGFTGTLGWPAQFVVAPVSGTTRFCIGLKHGGGGHNVYAFNTATGALIANVEWPYLTVSGGNLSWYNLLHDGTSFWGNAAHRGQFQKFSDWTWTTESAKYWVGYSWYDSAGTTHETALGPRQNITMKKRSQMYVTTAPLPPGGGADDPDRRRIYMERGSSAPAAGGYKLQTTTTSTNTTLTTFATGGAADGGGTAFAAATGGQLKSNAGEWLLQGDGSAAFTTLGVGAALLTNPSSSILNVAGRIDGASANLVEADDVRQGTAAGTDYPTGISWFEITASTNGITNVWPVADPRGIVITFRKAGLILQLWIKSGAANVAQLWVRNWNSTGASWRAWVQAA